MSQHPAAHHKLAVEVHLQDVGPVGVVFNALLELGVIQHIVGRIVADAMQRRICTTALLKPHWGCSSVPLRKTTTLSSTNTSRCSDEPLPPSGRGPTGQRHLAQGPAPINCLLIGCHCLTT
ncbi:hypothetical protein MG293_005718 [Ovis ammon polii]|uniref:Uncharacterized protein n=1 Tax=Ovis ammon polii TaxID=230172 RepID=A0AAD4UIV2_OVIAM|nr:hypothetical protein MG293_005718 [Ovis ammon polii]